MAHEGAGKKFETDEEASSSIHATGVKTSRSTSRRVKNSIWTKRAGRWCVTYGNTSRVTAGYRKRAMY